VAEVRDSRELVVVVRHHRVSEREATLKPLREDFRAITDEPPDAVAL